MAAVALLFATLSACAGDDTPHASDAPSTTATLPDGYLHVVFNDEGIVVEPALDGQVAKWSRSEARAAIRKNQSFVSDSTAVWFGNYRGQEAWLALAKGTVAPSLGPPQQGYWMAVFADGEEPARAMSPLATTGGSPRVDVAPPRPRYNGRLHITFVTPSGGGVGESQAKWMLEPAAWAHPLQSLEDARRRLQSDLVNPGGEPRRVYFGLFTGMDDKGTMHQRTKAWMAIGYDVQLYPRGRTTDTTPRYGFGVTAFSDDLTRPWVSSRLTWASPPPLVY